MRPHPRTRKTIKWAGAAALAALLAPWALSGWWQLVWISRGAPSVIGLGFGCIYAVDEPGTPEHCGLVTYWVNRRTRAWRVAWWPGWQNTPPGGHIPLWLPALPLLLTTAAAWRLDTRARRRLPGGTPLPILQLRPHRPPHSHRPMPRVRRHPHSHRALPPQRGASE